MRSGFTRQGAPESVAAHSWRLCLLVMLMAGRAGVDPLRALSLAVVHDLGEALNGDTPAVTPHDPAEKSARERRDLATLAAAGPPWAEATLAALWEEYEAAATPEARLVKALDKIETLLTHAEGLNPPDFDYAFNLAYGRPATDRAPAVAALRAAVDALTRGRMAGG